jgi:hypothetical protein
VAVDRATGEFAVVWTRGGDVVGRRFAGDGSAAGPEVRVNGRAGRARAAELAADGAGGWVAAWETATGKDVAARRHLFAGPPASPEVTANASTHGVQARPVVAADASGNFVVVWEDAGGRDGGYGVFAQRFDASGSAVGEAFPVSEATTGQQRAPSIAMDPAGNFVVAWVDAGVAAQRFDAAANRVGAELRLSASGAVYAPKVALDGGGHALVVWQSERGPRLLGRRFDATGDAVGPEPVVIARDGSLASLAGSAAGFVVVWVSESRAGGFGQRIDADGERLGPAFPINPAGEPIAGSAAVSMDDAGGFVVAWIGGVARDVRARRFASATSSGDALVISPP